MKPFTVKVGKETVRVSETIGLWCIQYKGHTYLFDRIDHVWVQTLGDLDDKTVQAIGKAIERYAKSQR